MGIEIKAPQFPESVADGTVATWHKQPGESVSRDELLVDIETDKVVLEVVAPDNGVLASVLKNEGDTVESQEVLAVFEVGGQGAATSAPAENKSEPSEESEAVATAMSPAVRKMVAEHQLDAASISATGKGGRLTKEDVQAHLNQASSQEVSVATAPKPASTPVTFPASGLSSSDREERRVPMTRLRKRIAERLLEASQSTAMLTTFNEVDMQPIMNMRKHYQADFEKAHGVRLGFMSFFVRAACEALKRFPAVNASIDGDDIVYHGFYDVGVAVSSDRGLVVPVLRDSDKKGLAEIESQIIEYGTKAKAGKLSMDDMTGGTFTISNGGVFGSLLSTPILNPPQAAILGMHTIQKRPVVVDDKIEIRPMMYLALSYDHRLIDGKEAVSFLLAIKEFVEDPARLLLDI